MSTLPEWPKPHASPYKPEHYETVPRGLTEAALARLRAARPLLERLAWTANQYMDDARDVVVSTEPYITLGECRAARALLADLEPTAPPR